MKNQLYLVRASSATTVRDVYVVATSREKAVEKVKKKYPFLYGRIYEELGDVIL
jgi:hypothetical protein